MTIYKNKRLHTRYYRNIYVKHYGPVPREPNGRIYDIHHIDGNHNNNDPSNLVAVTLQEHYDIHYQLGDWGACTLMAVRLQKTPEEISELSKKAQMERIERGTHHLCQRGLSHPKTDKKLYTLQNISTGECQSGTRQELMEKCSLTDNNISRLVLGRNKSQAGWVLSASKILA